MTTDKDGGAAFPQVKVTAADCNFQIEPKENGWLDWFDGWPFSNLPAWIIEAVNDHVVMPHRHRHTDYAQWLVTNPDGSYTNVGPGDFIAFEGGKVIARPKDDHYSSQTDDVVRRMIEDGHPLTARQGETK